MEIFDTVQAYQVEPGDQIIVDGDPIEVNFVSDDNEDSNVITIRGFSHGAGDSVTFDMSFDSVLEVWGI